MAYKILGTLLPIDIVNIVLDYKEYDTHTFKLYRKYNVNKAIYIGRWRQRYKRIEHDYWYLYIEYDKMEILETIRQIKNWNYARTYFSSFRGVINMDVNDNMFQYIRLNVIKCHNCLENNNPFCTECNFNQCKDSEIILYRHPIENK